MDKSKFSRRFLNEVFIWYNLGFHLALHTKLTTVVLIHFRIPITDVSKEDTPLPELKDYLDVYDYPVRWYIDYYRETGFDEVADELEAVIEDVATVLATEVSHDMF